MMHKSRGIGLISFLIIIIFLGVFLMLAVRLLPVYLEDYQVKKILNNVAIDPGIKEPTLVKMKSTLEKNFQVNNIKQVRADALLKIKAGTGFQLNYEVRVHAMANIDAVLLFSHQIIL